MSHEARHPETDFLAELRRRNLIHQATDEAGLIAHLAGGRRKAYIGFDPTADSLTVGNLVPIMLLARFQRCGHTPVVLMGGGTGLIGDPSGKFAERQLMTRERVAANVEAQKKIFSRVIDFGGGRAELVNNLDWLGPLTFLDALRDVGKHFSVNAMIQRDSVRDRLHNRDQGISYTEFSYMILQAYDFLHLFEKGGVTLQMGASDQWGNIVAGLDLISRRNPAAPAAAFGLTTPLITKADGGKFGKSESGAVWLSPDRTSPYAFYQFWLNAADADIPKFILTYTLWSRGETEAVIAAHAANPAAREANRKLARHMTELLHGPTEADAAEAAAGALFAGDIAALPPAVLEEALASAPSSTHDKASLGAGVPVVDLLVTVQLAQSKREAKEFLASGSVTVNGRKVGPEDRVATSDLLHGRVIALRRGKKNWHVTRWA
ncbi:MAG: tyrosine--tRNA ligase [Phycisphaerales bacterium]|nr:tyrosine--tRNA ligase [Phycisphaerales bacterium]